MAFLQEEVESLAIKVGAFGPIVGPFHAGDLDPDAARWFQQGSGLGKCRFRATEVLQAVDEENEVK